MAPLFISKTVASVNEGRANRVDNSRRYNSNTSRDDTHIALRRKVSPRPHCSEDPVSSSENELDYKTHQRKGPKREKVMHIRFKHHTSSSEEYLDIIIPDHDTENPDFLSNC